MITYDDRCGHVCTCAELEPIRDTDGEAVMPDYAPTVHAVREVEPTETGSWLYECERCGATAWSGL